MAIERELEELSARVLQLSRATSSPDCRTGAG